MSSVLPEDVQRLIHQHLPSMEHVEVLLHLARAAPQARSPIEIATELRTPVEATTTRLGQLLESELAVAEVSPDGTKRFRFQASGLRLKMAVEALAEAYKVRPVSLIRFVYERPSIAAHEFADAFRFRKKVDE